MTIRERDLVVVTVPADAVRPVGDKEIAHVRRATRLRASPEVAPRHIQQPQRSEEKRCAHPLRHPVRQIRP